MRKPILLLCLLVFAAPAWAQSVGIKVGKVLAFDREAHLLVLTDRNVWSLPDSSKSRIRVRGEDGDYRIMPEDERQTRIAEAQENIALYCVSSG